MFDMGLRLKELRLQKGYSQLQIAERINKSKTAVSKYESNQQMPTLEVLIELAHIYNVSLDYLVGMEKQSLLINGVSESQLRLIEQLLTEFRNPSLSIKAGLSQQQLQIMNSMIIEFTNK